MQNKHMKNRINLIAKELAKYRGKLLPLPIFLEIYKLIVPATIEMAPIYFKNNKLKILLTKRGQNDPTWPNLYHLPGTVIRTTDKIGNLNDAFKRILISELKNIEIIGSPIFIGPMFRNLGRGKEITLLCWVRLKQKPKFGKLFPIDKLPKNIIKPQIKFIKIAVKHFQKHSIHNS